MIHEFVLLKKTELELPEGESMSSSDGLFERLTHSRLSPIRKTRTRTTTKTSMGPTL